MKKVIFWILVCLIAFNCLSCSKEEIGQTFKNFKNNFHKAKEEIGESIKVRLHDAPFIGRYIHLPPPPKELYNATKEIILNLKKLNAESLYPEEYKKVLSQWEEAQALYNAKYYKKAKEKLEEVKKQALALEKQIKTYWENLQNQAWAKYKQIEKQAKKLLYQENLSKQEKLNIELYLWKLRSLIVLREFEKFERELQNKPF